jgi:hypothetical protein
MDRALYGKGISIRRFGMSDGLFKAGHLFIWTKNFAIFAKRNPKKFRG